MILIFQFDYLVHLYLYIFSIAGLKLNLYLKSMEMKIKFSLGIFNFNWGKKIDYIEACGKGGGLFKKSFKNSKISFFFTPYYAANFEQKLGESIYLRSVLTYRNHVNL